MDVKEKLVELLKTNACPSPFMCDPTCRYYGFGDCFPDRFADYLIAHGVTVQECKLGDKETNADRIRSMSDEELKEFICSMFKCEFCDFELGERCGLLNWLRMPAQEDDNGGNKIFESLGNAQ